jgi:hypothetical protein
MSEIRFITVPAPVKLAVDGAPAPIESTFEALIKERTADQKFGANLDGIMLGVGLRQAFTGCTPGDVIGVPLDQWERLCDVVREPSGGYNAAVVYQLLPHLRAILDAPSTRPVVAPPEDHARQA